MQFSEERKWQRNGVTNWKLELFEYLRSSPFLIVWIDSGRRIIGLILTQSIGGKNPGVEFMEAVNASVIK